jgi:hypothetical protein
VFFVSFFVSSFTAFVLAYSFFFAIHPSSLTLALTHALFLHPILVLSDAVKNQLIFRRSRAFSPEELNFLVTGQDPEVFRAARDANFAASHGNAALRECASDDWISAVSALDNAYSGATTTQLQHTDATTPSQTEEIAPARCTVRAYLEVGYVCCVCVVCACACVWMCISETVCE